MRMESPMVMMIILNIPGFLSHEKNTSCTAMPTRPVAATATAMASGRGRNACRETAIMPPSMRNSPWAKLMTPVEL